MFKRVLLLPANPPQQPRVLRSPRRVQLTISKEHRADPKVRVKEVGNPDDAEFAEICEAFANAR